jgi:flagellar motor switch protein FliN/FliY
MTKSQTLSELGKFSVVADIPLTIYAELDRRTITFRELLELAPDTLLALTRPAGENIDLYAGEVLIASGEVLVVDARLAVRIADILDRPSGPRPEQTPEDQPNEIAAQ